MDQQQIRANAERFIDALHRIEDQDGADVAELAGLFADQAELSNPILASQGRARSGRDDIAAFWRNYRATFRNIHSEFSDITASERAAGLFWHSSGEDATGQPLAYDGVTLLTFDEDGRIARMRGYFDTRQTTRGANH